jgi:phosphatidylserine/phosphatidylglycerophosphate/cardiolipin synthase-like enzyme
LRARLPTAVPVLDNFVKRWNADLDGVKAKKTIAHGVAPGDALDVDALLQGVDRATKLEGAVVSRRTVPSGFSVPFFGPRLKETLDTYETWIGRAEKRIFIANQYFRLQRVADLVKKQLDDQPELRVTLVMPSYSEEMAEEPKASSRDISFAKLRQQYADASPARRAELLPLIRKKALQVDPVNKLTVYMQSRCLAALIDHPRVRIWIPRPLTREGRVAGTPYVHLKMLVVDDAALMIGSANVNGRSLLGLADSEINLLLTSAEEIARIKQDHPWDPEPADEKQADYAGTWWYAGHNLIRYTKPHWEVDAELGRFPVGRAAILEYAASYKKNARVEAQMGRTAPADLGKIIDQVPSLLFNPASDDMGALLVKCLEHLV